MGAGTGGPVGVGGKGESRGPLGRRSKGWCPCGWVLSRGPASLQGSQVLSLPDMASPLTFVPSVLSHSLSPLRGPGLGWRRGLTTPPASQALVTCPCQALGHSAVLDRTVGRPFLSRTPSLNLRIIQMRKLRRMQFPPWSPVRTPGSGLEPLGAPGGGSTRVSSWALRAGCLPV